MMWKKRMRGKFYCLMVMVVLALAACGKQETNGSSDLKKDGESTSKVKLVLNWFAKSEHAGQYTALENGYFKEKGLDVTIEPGGPQVSAIQMVASGKAEFGLAHADQLLIARNQGIELIAFAATMQHSPQGIMYHEGQEINSFKDLNGRTMYVQPGIPYWEYLKKKYKLNSVKELNLSGDYTSFLANEKEISQCFINQEPISLETKGVKLETKLISESGYDPYTAVLFTTKDYYEKNKETVKSFVGAYVQGWNYYKDHMEEGNKLVYKVNPNMEKEELTIGAEEQKAFIYEEDAKTHGFGYMSEERWAELIDQLLDLGLLEEKVAPSKVFSNEFLEGN